MKSYEILTLDLIYMIIFFEYQDILLLTYAYCLSQTLD